MARLPNPGGDSGNWGTILNDYLSQALDADGTIKDNAVTANTIAPNSVTNAAIANDAVNATSIADGSITETLLAGAVQTKLNQAAPTWSTLSGKPAVIAAGADSATARDTIGAAGKRRARAALSEGKIKGGNITVKPNGGSWGGMWAEWDWDNWIKPQIDRAIVLGLNTIRVLGAPEAVVNPAATPYQISQATYDSHWQQLAQYCLDNGLRLYACLTEEWAFHGYTGAPNNFQDATVTSHITTTASVLAAYENVIAFEVFQEGKGTGSGLVLADVLAMFAAIRAAAPGIPLSISSSSAGFGTTAGFWNDTSSMSYQAWTSTGGADFVDIHIYLTGASTIDVDAIIEHTGLPVLIGEYGTDQTLTSSDQVLRYRSGRTIHNRPGILGSLVWALADQGTSTANQAGIWDNTGFSQPSWPSSVGSTPLSTTSGQRTILVNELHWFATAWLPAQTQISQPNLLPARTSRPVNSTSGWTGGANTYLWTDPKGLGVGALAAGNLLAGTSSVLSPASPTTPYRADIEILTLVAGRTATMAMNSYDSSGTYLTTSTSVTVTSSVNTVTPTRISGVFTSHSSAAYVALIVTMTGAAAANEWMLILASPRPRLAAI